ncbi:MAG: hypothetical protein FGM32_11805 [Candidatus Kapabacteria bacterium]|nr:hypothetical protein [Candidatus Kapabacteria bacterium]
MLSSRIFWLCVLSGVLRLAVLWVTPMGEPHEYEQVVIARNMLAGDGFGMAWPYQPLDSARAEVWRDDPTPHPSAFMPPFVPAVATAVFAVAGGERFGIMTMLVLQCLVGALIPWLIYRIAQRMASERASMIAAAWSLVFVPGLVSSATPAGAVWYTVCGLIVVDLAQQVLAGARRVWLFGIALGLLTLMRSEFLALGVVMCCLPVLKRNWKGAALALAMMMVVIAPWLVRNANEFGQTTGIITHPWREMWRGANDYASGSGYAADGWNIWEGERYPEIVRKLDSIPLTQTFELDADKVFQQEVKSYIAADPMRWVVLGIKKVGMLWTVDPYYPKGRSIAYIVPTLLTGLVLLAGLVLASRRLVAERIRTTDVLPILLIAVGMSGLFAITYVLPRYQTYLFTVCMPLIALVADMVMSRRSAAGHELRG